MRQPIFTLTIFLLTSFSDNLFACSCKPEKTVRNEIKHSDAVIVGTIISGRLENVYRDTTMNYAKVMRYDLLVQDIYKGVITIDTVAIYTGLGSNACGVMFVVGSKYIVYGKNESYYHGKFNFPTGMNIFWTNSCMRTKDYLTDEIVEIKKYAKKLGDN